MRIGRSAAGEGNSQQSELLPFSAPKKRCSSMLSIEKYRPKRYLHFDHRVKIEYAEHYVTNPQKIAQHSFLPLIHYTSSFYRNIGKKNPEMNNRPIKQKEREIMYAGHWDSHVYKYYSEMLNNDYYNYYCQSYHIDDCVIAYRNNKPGKSNIDFAAEVINFIALTNTSYILIGDFSTYFDTLDHSLLKEKLKKVMGTPRLAPDWFNVFQSITKYGYYDKSFVENIVGTDRYLKSQKKTSYFNQVSDFRKFQREFPTQKNKKKYGIPQGTAISATLANIYAIDFDIELKNIAEKYSGIYRRYSDDFSLVLPAVTSLETAKDIESSVRSIANEKNKIIIQEQKTGLFLYKDQQISQIDHENKRCINYLGFIFDGKSVMMRGKSVYKFYRKADDLINMALSKRWKEQSVRLPYKRKIYKLYTDFGKYRENSYGNFITYAQRAQNKFDHISPHTKNIMMQQIKNRKKIIEKKLGIKIHIKP